MSFKKISPSSTPSPSLSRSLRHLRTATIVYWIFLTLLLWLPDPRALLFGWEPSEGPRGYAHVITFGLLGLLVELGRRKHSVFFWFAVLVGYTFLTEIVQEFLPIRTFEWEDILQDVVGAALGMGAGIFVRFLQSTFVAPQKNVNRKVRRRRRR